MEAELLEIERECREANILDKYAKLQSINEGKFYYTLEMDDDLTHGIVLTPDLTNFFNLSLRDKMRFDEILSLKMLVSIKHTVNIGFRLIGSKTAHFEQTNKRTCAEAHQIADEMDVLRKELEEYLDKNRL